VRIAANLRHDVLEDEIDEETLAAGLPPRFRSPPSSRSCTAWRST
jgi:hypothetical protein